MRVVALHEEVAIERAEIMLGGIWGPARGAANLSLWQMRAREDRMLEVVPIRGEVAC